MKSTNLSKISLILGIVSAALATIECFLPFIMIGFVCGFVAIVLGFIARKQEKNNLSFSGIVLGVCGMLVALIWLYLYIIA